jgi:hypothetical protein
MADEFDGLEPTAEGTLLVQIERYLGGAASETEVAQLNSDLAASKENRDLFVRLANLSGLIVEHFSLSRAHADIEVSLREVSKTASPSEPISDRKSKKLILRFLGRAPGAFTRPVLWSIAVVALLFYSGFVVLSWNLRPDKLPSFAVGSPESVAMVRNTTDVQWAKNTSSRSAEASILSGEPLKINSGTMEIELQAGTKLVVEAPAEWSVDGNNSVSLRAGKLVARVPKEAIGFMVETPTAEIVDLGTEFGVEVNTAGDSEVHVFKGSVEARATGLGSRPLRLFADESVRINVGQAEAERCTGKSVSLSALRNLLDEKHDLTNKPIVLFYDNFNGSDTRHDIDLAINDRVRRQGGLLRRLTYTRFPAERGKIQLARNGDDNGLLRLTADAASGVVAVSPNANFKSQRPDGVRFVFEVDITPPTSIDAWAGVVVGAENQQIAMGDPGGIGFLVRECGRFESVDGTGNLNTYATTGDFNKTKSGWYRVRVEYSVLRFGGDQPVDVNVFIDDVRAAQFRTRAAIRENFVILQALSNGESVSSSFDNLSIRTEPISLPMNTN